MTVLCEVCHSYPATAFGYFQNRETGEARWKLVCCCVSYIEDYYIDFSAFTEDPVSWISHLMEKRWFNKVDFLNTLHRAGLETTPSTL